MSLLIYNPNEAACTNTVHVVKIKVRQWEYAKEYVVKVGGCMVGASALGCAIEQVVSEIVGERKPDEPVIIELVHGEDTLEIDLNEDGEPEWCFKKMVVAAEIIDIERIHPKSGT